MRLPGPPDSEAFGAQLATAVRHARGSATSANGVDGASIDTFAGPAEAWRAASASAGPDDRIVVFGSFLTVAGVMKAREPDRSRGASSTPP